MDKVKYYHGDRLAVEKRGVLGNMTVFPDDVLQIKDIEDVKDGDALLSFAVNGKGRGQAWHSEILEYTHPLFYVDDDFAAVRAGLMDCHDKEDKLTFQSGLVLLLSVIEMAFGGAELFVSQLPIMIIMVVTFGFTVWLSCKNITMAWNKVSNASNCTEYATCRRFAVHTMKSFHSLSTVTTLLLVVHIAITCLWVAGNIAVRNV